MNVNLKQLAEMLGLSQTTVSRALNGYPEVNAETRAARAERRQGNRIQAEPAAQRLATGQAGSIGLVMPIAQGIDSDLHFGEFLAGLGEEAVRHDFHFVINAERARRTRKRPSAAGGQRQCRCPVPRLYAGQ